MRVEFWRVEPASANIMALVFVRGISRDFPDDGGALGPRGIGVGATVSSRCLFAPVIRFRYSLLRAREAAFHPPPGKLARRLDITSMGGTQK